MLLSILVPTLTERRLAFERLHAELMRQIDACGAHGTVQVLSFADNRERSTGEKRNLLMQRASGLFIAFVDDDDSVSTTYVAEIVQALEQNPDVDCVGLRGQIIFRGRYTREFRHSLRYNDYFSRGGVYYRPPYHLNPIRRSIAASYPFAHVSYSEDIDWAMRLKRDDALRREVFIDSILYVYHCRRDFRYQWLLDHTEGIRHALGLRAANRLKLYAGQPSPTQGE